MLKLPPLPATLIGPLTDEQIERVERHHPRPPGKTIDDWCPTCRGEKTINWYVEQAKPYAEREAAEYECPCRDQFRLWRLFHYAGLGGFYPKLGWGDTFGVEADVFAFIHSYVSDLAFHLRQGTGLLLRGPNGNGKTLLASLILRQALADGHTGYWATFAEMLDLYTSGWGAGERAQADKDWFEATVSNAEVLVIDDVGQESVNYNSVALPALDRVFRSRVQDGCVTIITTNLGQAAFAQRYSKSVVSLATEACLPYNFTGGDWRESYAVMKEIERRKRIIRPLVLR